MILSAVVAALSVWCLLAVVLSVVLGALMARNSVASRVRSRAVTVALSDVQVPVRSHQAA